jgi:polyferredoxin
MPLGRNREKTLHGLATKRGTVHRYTWIRWAVAVVFTAAIAALPLTGTLRFDLWSGRHMYLGEELDFVTVAKRFAFPFLGVNVLIIVATRFLGRYLCGFVCPYGSLARLAEWLRFREVKRKRTQLIRMAGMLSICLTLAAITFSFWVDWRVFVEGSALALTLSSVFLFGMTFALYGSVMWLGLHFCHEWCPSGVYFALLGPETKNGIEFAHPETCTECKACEVVCPMGLPPTEMASAPRSGAGLYPDWMSNDSLCIRCGDCVAVCEDATRRHEVATPLEMGWLSQGRATEGEHADVG